jgi:hypothetical protein
MKLWEKGSDNLKQHDLVPFLKTLVIYPEQFLDSFLKSAMFMYQQGFFGFLKTVLISQNLVFRFENQAYMYPLWPCYLH